MIALNLPLRRFATTSAAKSVFLALAALLVCMMPGWAAAQERKWIGHNAPALGFHAMAYDSARGVTVRFGGGTFGWGDRLTWEWDGAKWKSFDVFGPSAREGTAMAYDSARGVTVLFGGYQNRETWEWNGTTWTQRVVSGPSQRFYHAMAYDSARGVTVLFGGLDGSQPNGETWEWDGNSWTRRLVNGPSPRYATGMVYDSARGVCVLFGGGTSGDFPDNQQLWEWNGTTWTIRTDGVVAGRAHHAMAYDSVRNVTIVFGGVSFNDGGTLMRGDTWEWNGSSWSPRFISGPSNRWTSAMAFDEARGVTVLFAGRTAANGSFQFDNETWMLNASGWSVHGPQSRGGCAMVFDEARSLTTLFGGTGVGPYYTLRTGTWVWDGNAWTQRTAIGPPGRYGHAMTYDSGRSVAVLFGGNASTSTRYTDTWEWNGTTWTPRQVTGPSAGYQAAMSYDSARGVVVLFGGLNGNIRSGETWEWDGVAWRQRSATGPPPRYWHSMAYDSRRGVTVLFGGLVFQDSVDRDGGDTWEWDGSSWTQRFVPGPSPRYGHGMAFDSLRGVTVLVGGVPGGIGQTWEWDGSAWTQPEISGTIPQSSPELAYDSVRHTLIQFGGYAETWELRTICRADLDNDGDFANGLTPDHAVTIDDFLSFLVGFEAGNVLVDFDNPWFTGEPDGAVDVNDLLSFLARFEAGC